MLNLFIIMPSFEPWQQKAIIGYLKICYSMINGHLYPDLYNRHLLKNNDSILNLMIRININVHGKSEDGWNDFVDVEEYNASNDIGSLKDAYYQYSGYEYEDAIEYENTNICDFRETIEKITNFILYVKERDKVNKA